MESFEIGKFVVDLLVVLFAGLLSGVICKRAGVSLLVGYLIIGAVIGEGGLGLVSQGHHELEFLARAGALLLLFSVGIEFSLDELRRMSGHFFVALDSDITDDAPNSLLRAVKLARSTGAEIHVVGVIPQLRSFVGTWLPPDTDEQELAMRRLENRI